MRRAVTVLVLVALAAGVSLWIARSTARPTVGQGFVTWALFRDGSKLPIGSQVAIAGVRVGEIEALTVEGGLARISMRLRDDVELYADAWAMKKSSALLGDDYVEISPGGPEAPGAPAPPRLRSGEPITRVIEGASTDRLLRTIDRTLPRADRGLASASAAIDVARSWVGGVLDERVGAAERYLDSDALTAPLALAAEGAAGLERFTERVERRTAGASDEILGALGRWRADSERIAGMAADARAWTSATFADVRAGLDAVDPHLERATRTVAAWAERTPTESRSSWHRLLHDDDLANDLSDAAAQGAAASGSLDRLRAFVGFRTEYNLRARPRFYLVSELAGRGDTFYRFELTKDGLGGAPEIEVADAPGGAFTQRARITEGLRVTAQWGKRLGPLAVRFGLKESSFGAGADLVLLGGRLGLSGDVNDAAFGELPRLKLAAALEVFRSIYVLAGVDDALNAARELPVAAWPAGAGEPVFFEDAPTGRDLFLGAMLTFDEADLTKLLMLYGGLAASLL